MSRGSRRFAAASPICEITTTSPTIRSIQTTGMPAANGLCDHVARSAGLLGQAPVHTATEHRSDASRMSRALNQGRWVSLDGAAEE